MKNYITPLSKVLTFVMGVLFRKLWTGKDQMWKELAWIGPVESLHPEPRRCVSTFDKLEIMKRQNNTCNFCSTDITSGMYSNSDLDHIVCISMGGLTVTSNLQFLCVACHRRKTSLENRKDVKIIDMKPLKNQVYIVYTDYPSQELPIDQVTPMGLNCGDIDSVLALGYVERREGYSSEDCSLDNIFEKFKYVK